MERFDEYSREVELRVILFQIDKLKLFARLSDVLEILKIENVRKLPCSRKYLDGLFEYRKKILPYYDARKRLNLPETTGNLSFVFFKEGFEFAFKIDRTLGTFYAKKADITKPKSDLNGLDKKYILSVLLLEDTKALELDYKKYLQSEFLR